MANEAIIVELLGNQGEVIQVTVADGVTIEKGTLMKLSDPRTGAASSTDGDLFIGITVAEKVANDGSTEVGVYTKGIFDLVDSGVGITIGNKVTIGGANTVKSAVSGDSITAEAFGVALETAAASERIEVLIGGY